MHEVVFTDKRQSRKGVHTLDIAKRLIDYGFHPMTIYFPLIVQGAMLIEPTESVGRQELDQFIAAMKSIASEAVENPELVLNAPHDTRIGRLDEAAAARKPVLRWKPKLGRSSYRSGNTSLLCKHAPALSFPGTLINARRSTGRPFTMCSSTISGTSLARTCAYQTPSG